MATVLWEKSCTYLQFLELFYSYDHGYHNIVCIDYSDAVIETMNKRKGGRKGLVYQVMDATNMTFENEEFDVVIDKVWITNCSFVELYK